MTKLKWIALAFALLSTSLAFVLLSGRVRVYFLGQSLRAARSPSEIETLVRDILEYDNVYARDVVAQFAAESPLRAFDRKHGLFLMHDDSEGRTYEIAMCDQGRVEMPAGLPSSVQTGLTRATRGAMGQIRSSFRHGDPPSIFSGIHLLVDRNPDQRPNEDHVSFVLKGRDEDKYLRIDFVFEDEVLVETVYLDVSRADVQRWSRNPSWPAGWKEPPK